MSAIRWTSKTLLTSQQAFPGDVARDVIMRSFTLYWAVIDYELRTAHFLDLLFRRVVSMRGVRGIPRKIKAGVVQTGL